MNPLEAILRLCAKAAPGPWYPRVDAGGDGLDPRALVDGLEALVLDGFLDKVPGTAETGPGFALTDKGRAVLHDPQVLEQLQRGLSPQPSNRGALIHRALRRPARPVVTRLLLLANFLWFGYEVYLAHSIGKVQNLLSAFLRNDPAIPDLIRASGGLTATDVLHGEWWRLLSSGFVHIGLVHLCVNMYMLHALGSFVEAMWGRWRYLVIYLFGLLGGGCLAVAYTPVGVYAGASGALFGVFAADGVWILLNGKYLPPNLAGRARSNLLLNVIILVAISMVPGVSGAGHLGGALGGGAAALLLHLQRFSPAPWRWLALAGLVPLPLLGYGIIRWQRTHSQAWHQRDARESERRHAAEIQDFQKRFLDPKSDTCIRTVMNRAIAVYGDLVEDLLDMHPSRRDPADVKQALRSLDEQHARVLALAQALDGAGPYEDEAAERARQTALEYVQARAHLLDLARQCLRAPDRWTDRDEVGLHQQEKKVLELRNAWNDLLR